MTSTPRSRRISQGAKFALLVLGLIAVGPGFARSSDREQTMQVDAQHFDGFQKPDSISTLTGKVSITQGTLKATGSMARVYFDGDSQISRVIITGNPAHIQQLDDKGNLMTGTADSIDYDNIKQIAVLSGHATVKQKGRGEANGDKLTYNTQTSQMTGESNGDGLVHMTFQPKPRVPAAKSPTPAKGQP